MLESQTPTKIPLAWAASAGGAYITYPVPTPSQVGITNGAASWTDGFPPNNFIPLGTGGAGPFGKDFNGMLRQTTAGVQWLQAGGPIFYDAAFSSEINGYPDGAILYSSGVIGKFWICGIDNNTSNPDTGGTNWQPAYYVTNPGTAGIGLVSTGPTTPPAFGAVNLTVTGAVAGKLPVANAPVQLLLDAGHAGPGTYSYTVPANTFALFGQVQGAGGSGGGLSSVWGGGGGGSGGFAQGWFAVTPGQVLTVVVGAGGAVAGPGGDGLSGGSSSISSSGLSATGGGGGIGNAGAGAATGGESGVGTAASGQFQCQGGQGGDGFLRSACNGAGNGAASFFGGGTRGSSVTVADNPAFGAGGGGAYSISGSSPNSGAGAQGAVLIWG